MIGLANKEKQRGIALVIVLWISVIITLLVASFINIARTQIAVSGTETGLMQHYTLIEGALDVVMFRIIDERKSKKWLSSLNVQKMSLGRNTLEVKIADPGGLVDLNSANGNMLVSLLLQITGNRILSEKIASQIILRRNNLNSTVRRGNNSNKSRRFAFRHIDELRQLSGINSILYSKIAPFVTVHSGQKKINPSTAPKTVLRAIPGFSKPLVDDLVKKRSQDPTNKKNYADAITRSDGLLAVRKRKTFIIYITSPWGPEKKMLGRRFVVAIGLDNKTPYHLLSWSEFSG